MRMQRNFYEVLGVPRNASNKEIKEKYYILARQFHPDRAKDKQLADRLFVQINRAYSTLYNDAKREKYDASLDATSQMPSRPGAPQPSSRPASAPEPVSPQQVRAWFDQASRMQLAGDLTQAIMLCSKTIEAEPNNFPGLLLMGDLLAQTGKPHEASLMYERASKIQPSNHLLREKMIRLNALIERRTTNPGVARPAQPNLTSASTSQRPQAPQARPINGQRPPVAPIPTAQRAPVPPPAPPKPPVKPEPKSLFDRLLNRK